MPALPPDARVEIPVTPQADPNQQAGTRTTTAGFLVTLEGYSPYREIGDLLDPSGVDKREKWGLVTRLLHLAELDANSPFVLLDKTKASNFEIDKGPVDPNTQKMPRGIGVVRPAQEGTAPLNRDQQVLIDPMTSEVISQVRVVREGSRPMLGSRRPTVEDNDWWFVLKFKLAWKEAPVMPTSAAGLTQASIGTPYGQPAQAAPARAVLPE